MSPAKQAAMKLIQKYVERSDRLEFFKDYMGRSSPGGMSACIGGYQPAGGKYYSTDWILVDRDIDGKPCQERFKLREIYKLCKHGQQSLL
jgi:hypothetical protein